MAQIRIIQELEQTTYEFPGEERKQMVILYQAEGRAPRTVWIYKDLLPDLMWLQEHPEATEAPPELEKEGDKVRMEAIKADLEKIKLRRPRTLEI